MSRKRRKKRLILIGKGNGWQNAPLYGDFESWGVNDLVVNRSLDMVFDMHPLDERYNPNIEEDLKAIDLIKCSHDLKHQEVLNTNMGLKKTIDIINKQKIPFITLKHYDFCPTSTEYPLKEIVEDLRSDNFTNGIDYMLAYAIWKNRYDRIEMYGINMALGSEYEWEKPGVDFWIGYAKGRGIKVTVNSHITTLMKPRDGKLYGFGIPQFFKEGSLMELQKFTFTTLERILLLNIIPPQKGGIEKIRSAKILKEGLQFQQEEQEKIKLQQEPGGRVQWEEKEAKDKIIELDDHAITIIIQSLKLASDKGMLAENHEPLYTRFVDEYAGKLVSELIVSERK